MSEKKPYSCLEESFQELPLPDAEGSWKKMKKLLDEEDGGRRTPPFLVLRSCLPWAGLLLLLGLAAGLYFYLPAEWGKEAEVEVEAKAKVEAEVEVKKEDATSQQGGARVGTTTKTGSASSPVSGADRAPAVSTSSVGNGKKADGGDMDPRSSENGGTNSLRITAPAGSSSTPRTQATKTRTANKVNEARTAGAGSARVRAGQTDRGEPLQPSTAPARVEAPVIERNTGVPASNAPSPKPTDARVADSASAQKALVADSSKKADSTATMPEKKKTAAARKFIFSAGLGIQQGIPLGDQKTVPYSYYGRKSSLSDYIPSVWVKAQRGKFFLMGEFRYGAAQSVKEFSFSRKTTYDSATNSLTETSSRLMKTYYHQLPLTINYYLKPNWSVGLGGMYSVFHGAITERVVQRTNLQTQAKSVSREIVPIKHFTDSFLYKTQVHLLLQTDYEWRRFSLGLRYAWDVQPFIRYTTPSGELKEEKNQSLQAILRFRLWRSK